MDGKLFLGTARLLRSNGRDEAAYRSAVSRAYYACFLEARRVTFDNCDQEVRRKAGIRTERSILHESLQRYLKHSSDSQIQQLGQDLAGLRGNRLNADYGMSRSLTPDDAGDAVDEAQAFLATFSQVEAREVGRAMEDDIRTTYT